MNKIFIILLLFSFKVFSQTESNICFEKLKESIYENKAELTNKKIDSLFNVINCEIKGVDLTQCYPSDFKNNGCGIPKVENLKVKSILLFFNHRKSISVEDVLKPIKVKTKNDSLKDNLPVSYTHLTLPTTPYV